MTFNELHRSVLKAKKDNTPLPEGLSDTEKHQLNCLLHPDDHPLVWKLEDCDCTEGSCVSACTFLVNAPDVPNVLKLAKTIILPSAATPLKCWKC